MQNRAYIYQQELLLYAGIAGSGCAAAGLEGKQQLSSCRVFWLWQLVVAVRKRSADAKWQGTCQP